MLFWSVALRLVILLSIAVDWPRVLWAYKKAALLLGGL